ncbi:MAG: acylneuraminate cytidylyltransferase family protein [Candidatus Taylorbacteria bacterium]|nr:acylneuraminate cytidylyltransferase family protein [Candidatus Taylorbacteria bacterium]
MADKRPEVLGVILARGGSKSIPKKSITPCAGSPLMHYTIQAAKRAPSITRLIISTDDEEMAEFARSNGVEVPFMRPKELAEDLTPDLPVFEHVLAELKAREGYVPDVVVHLRPTTPLKKTSDIEAGIALLLSRPDAQSVRSICEPLHTPFKMYQHNEESGMLEPLLPKVFPEVFEQYPEAYNMPRQLLPKVWRHSGYIDVIRPDVISELHSMSGTRIVPLRFEKWRDIDIDSPIEVAMAEKVIQRLRAEGREPWD